MKNWFMSKSIAVRIAMVVFALAIVTEAGVGIYSIARKNNGTKNVEQAVVELGDEQVAAAATIGDEEETELKEESLEAVEVAKEDATDEEVTAAVYKKDSTDLVNGSFSNGLDGWEVYSFIEDNISTTVEDEFDIVMDSTGSEDWHVQLKQTGIRLENGKWYSLTMDAKSTMNRTISAIFQRDGMIHGDDWTPYSQALKMNLSNSWNTYNLVFQMPEGTDNASVFSISMGAVDGKKINATHGVSIDNVKLIKLPDNWTDTLKGEGNLVGNGDFSYKDLLWEGSVVAPGAANVDFSNGKAVFDIQNPGSLDWHVQLKQGGISLNKGNGYRLTFKASSSVERTVKVGFMDTNYVNWYGGADLKINAEEKTYTVDLFNSIADDPNAVMMISMGKIEGETTPASVITLDDFVLFACDAVTEATASGGGAGSWKDPNIQVGDNWVVYDHESTHTNNVYRDADGVVHIGISNTGSLDWHVQLQKKNVKLKKDKYYEMSFTAKSSLERDFTSVMQKDGSADNDWTPYSGDGKFTLGTKWKTYKKTFKMTYPTDKNVIYNFSFGTIDGKVITKQHEILIKDIVIKEVDEPVKPDPEIGEEILLNCNFEDDSYWDFNVATDNGAAATVKFENGKAIFKIKNTGKNSWDVQLKQEPIKLVKGETYELMLDGSSSLARDIKVDFLTPGDYDWISGATFALAPQADMASAGNMLDDMASAGNKQAYTFTVEHDTISDALIAISLGNMNAEGEKATPGSTITLNSISLKRVDPEKISETESEDDPENEVLAVETILNGDFKEAAKNWESYVANDTGADASVKFEEGKVTFDIKNTGKNAWDVQLKQAPIKLVKGTTYQLDMTAASTVNRAIKVDFLTPEKYDWIGGATLNLDAESKNQSFTFTVDRDDTANAVFTVSLGNVSETDEATVGSVVTITNISLKKVEISEESGENGESGSGEGSSSAVAADETILNGNFADAEKNWESYVANDTGADASVKFETGKVTFDIKNTGKNSWDVQLKQAPIKLVKGTTYQVDFTATSSVKRTVKVDFLTPEVYDWIGGASFDIDATSKTQSFTFTVDRDDTANSVFTVSLGNVSETEEATVGSVVTITDISLKMVDAPSEDVPSEDTPSEDTPSEETPVDGSNMLLNGAFDNGSSNWGVNIATENGAVATNKFENGKVIFDIANVGTENWHVQLSQSGVNMEAGATYKVEVVGSSSVARAVEVNFLVPGTYAWIGGSKIILEPTTSTQSFEFVAEKQAGENKSEFQVCLGKITDEEAVASVVTIDSIKVTKVKSATTEETPSEETPSEDTPSEETPSEDNPSEDTYDDTNNIILNGGFANGAESWGVSIADYAGAVATNKFGNGKAVFDIKNAGTENWHVQLTQGALNLEKGATYRVEVVGSSTVTRFAEVNFLVPEHDYAWVGGSWITLEPTKSTQTFEFVAESDYSSSSTLQFNLGKLDKQEAVASVVTIDSIKLTKIKDAETPSEDNSGNNDSQESNDNPEDAGNDTPSETPETPDENAGKWIVTLPVDPDNSSQYKGVLGLSPWDYISSYEQGRDVKITVRFKTSAYMGGVIAGNSNSGWSASEQVGYGDAGEYTWVHTINGFTDYAQFEARWSGANTIEILDVKMEYVEDTDNSNENINVDSNEGSNEGSNDSGNTGAETIDNKKLVTLTANENNGFDGEFLFKPSDYLSNYETGKKVKVVVSLNASDYFKGAIGGSSNVKDGWIQSPEFESTAENTQWDYVFDSFNDNAKIQIYWSNTDTIEVIDIQVSYVEDEGESSDSNENKKIVNIQLDPKAEGGFAGRFGLNPYEYIKDYLPGKRVRVVAQLKSNTSFNGALGGKLNAAGDWKQSETFEATNGETQMEYIFDTLEDYAQIEIYWSGVENVEIVSVKMEYVD